jgi:hypothetical protein
MALQRHPHDSVVTLPPPHADPSSDLFVPIPLRAAFDTLDAETIDKFRRELYSLIREPWSRKVNGRDRVLNHRSNEGDFAVALHAMKVDEAARRVAQAERRRDTDDRYARDHRCAICHRVDPTAHSSYIKSALCEPCRDLDAAQRVAEHGALMVNGKTVAELLAAHRKQTTP